MTYTSEYYVDEYSDKCNQNEKKLEKSTLVNTKRDFHQRFKYNYDYFKHWNTLYKLNGASTCTYAYLQPRWNQDKN